MNLGDDPKPLADRSRVEGFIARWKGSDGTERANYQLFLTELCDLLGLPSPDPAESDTERNAYVFERRVDILNPDGSQNRGFIDLYRRGHFVLEAKQTGKEIESSGWDRAMDAAYNQADQYVRALPISEGRPPFIVVTDVGRTLALYSEFSRSGGTYVPYPDPRRYRIDIADLQRPSIQHRLKLLWEDPDKLDPSKHAAKVTREVSNKLANLAKALETDGYDIARVAHFIKRALFTMFSEDVELLPEGSFTQLLNKLALQPDQFPSAIRSLWETMDTGGFCGVLMQDILQFNGGLFKGIDPIPLTAGQIQLLVEAANADWRFVEPAIFGTMLERALNPKERHKLGAHYTPRAYVERLVMPTIIDPLRRQWETTQVVAESYLQKPGRKSQQKALGVLQEFHLGLCSVRVLDPACGSGNFLYVSLEHLKRLEGEVLQRISDIDGGQGRLEAEGLTVSPHQFLGLELNPRAAAIAEIVLWIGYLQWHYRLHGHVNVPEPVLKDFHNIEQRDALIEYEGRTPTLDANGNPVTIWDGVSMKKSPVTGELVPDNTGQLPVYEYVNPKKASWPEADYIVGNPPFIGASTMRRALGDGYVDAVRRVYQGEVSESSDFVMYWWHIAALKVRSGNAKRFGLITTNSLRQSFNRRVLEQHLNDSRRPLSLSFAIPDHPWVDDSGGADVRISMSVGTLEKHTGVLATVSKELSIEDELATSIQERAGKITSDLRIGADVTSARPLESNADLSNRGVCLFGQGFIISQDIAKRLGFGEVRGIEKHIRKYRNGRDLVQKSRNLFVIDLFGLSAEEARARFPSLYQWVLEHVKPERENNRREVRRKNWWVFGEPNPKLRDQIGDLPRYIATVETAKHRLFTFLGRDILPDNKLVNIAVDGSHILGVLTSRVHVCWSMAAGGWLGVGNDPVYVKTRCFEPFPFPDLQGDSFDKIGSLAERIDSHRKLQQEKYSGLKLTPVYNILEKVRAEKPLEDAERVIYEQSLGSILKELHDDLDRAVFEAYGWSDLADTLVGLPGATTPIYDKPPRQVEAEEELLSRLVALNVERTAEEVQGLVRWLRPDYQAPDAKQASADLAPETVEKTVNPRNASNKQTWPRSLTEQVVTVRGLLGDGPRTTNAIATQFKRKPKKAVESVLAALAALGQIRPQGDEWQLVK